MIRLYDILEDSNNESLKNVGFENSNNLQIDVKSIEKISAFTSSKALKVLNIYAIVTEEDYMIDGKINDVFHNGEICTLCYDEKKDKNDLYNNYKFTIASIQNENGKIKINVTTKGALEKTEKCHIETNSELISSQYINQKFPKDIILTEVEKGSVCIKFKSTVSEWDGFVVAYRKSCNDNVKWNFIYTDKEECRIENIENVNYKVKVMYFNKNEYSMFSPEIDMKF